MPWPAPWTKARGAYVIGTASARNHAYLRELGADSVIDYTSTRFENVVRNMDVVVDAVGGETLDRSYGVLRKGGRLVSPGGAVNMARCQAAGIVCPARAPWDVQRGLTFAAPFIADGKLSVHVDSVYTLSQVGAAQQHSRSGRTRGKVVLDRLEYPDMLAWDHMTLIAQGGEWRIAVKAYDAQTPGR